MNRIEALEKFSEWVARFEQKKGGLIIESMQNDFTLDNYIHGEDGSKLYDWAMKGNSLELEFCETQICRYMEKNPEMESLFPLFFGLGPVDVQIDFKNKKIKLFSGEMDEAIFLSKEDFGIIASNFLSAREIFCKRMKRKKVKEIGFQEKRNEGKRIKYKRIKTLDSLDELSVYWFSLYIYKDEKGYFLTYKELKNCDLPCIEYNNYDKLLIKNMCTYPLNEFLKGLGIHKYKTIGSEITLL